MAETGSDSDYKPGDSGHYTSPFASPSKVESHSSKRTKRLLYLAILVSSIALLVAGVAVQRNIAQDNETAEERAIRAHIEAQRAQEEVEQVAVAACLQRNEGRKNQYDSNMALIYIVIQNRPSQPEALPPTITQYIEFTKTAYEPLDCNYDSPNFAVDTTPPAPFPPNPLIGENPYESIDR